MQISNDKVLDIAVTAGEILLRNGAEIYRVEDTINRICLSYNLKCQAFVLPTGIFVTVNCKPVISEIRRIKTRTVNLMKIDKINTFSRSLKDNPLSYEDAIMALEEIKCTPPYNNFIQLLCSAAIAFTYTMIFGGKYIEGLFALLIGVLLYPFHLFVNKHEIIPFFEYFLSGFISGAIAIILTISFTDLNIYVVIIGSLIILLPGVSLTNGIMDLLNGDIVSGPSRLGEAILTIVVLASGVAISLSIGFKIMEGIF